MIEPGESIADRFEVESLLGEGGIARVYLVRHTALGTIHALKLLTLQHPSLAERLMQEGRIQAQLRHPNIVAVTDIVSHRGQPGLLMEFVDCVPLDHHLHAMGALPLDEALDMFAAILAGMATAHDAGVLHRDLKPANVLLARTTRGFIPKISDFGIAKLTQGGGSSHTRAGITMGTPGYMAPEQFDDAANVTVRADIFALGAMLYELLTGARAFPSTNMREVLMASGAGQYVAPDELRPELSATIVEAIRTAMAPDPEARFADCRAFGRALFADDPARLAIVEAQSEAPRPALAGRTLPPQPPRPAAASQPTFDVRPGGTSLPSSETLAPPEPTAPRPATPSTQPPEAAPLFPDLGRGRVAIAMAALGLFGLAGAASLIYVGLQLRQEKLAAELAATASATEPTPPSATPAPATPAPAMATTPAAAATPTTPEPAAAAAPSTPTAPAAPATTTRPEGASSKTTSGSRTPASTTTASAEASPWGVETASAATASASSKASETASATLPELVGAWKSTTWTVNILSQDGATLSGFAYQTRASDRIQVRGSYDPASGTLTLRERGGSRLVVSGKVDGNTISGTYMLGRSEQQNPWQATRAK